MKHSSWRDFVDVDSDTGFATVKNLNIPVLRILARLYVHGYKTHELLNDFPGLSLVQIEACREYGEELARNTHPEKRTS